MEALYTAIVTSVGGRNGQVKSSDGILDFEVRPPKEMGGSSNAFANPEQLFAAGYSACFGSAINHIALLKRKRVESVVTGKVSIGNKVGGGFQLSVEMDVTVSGVTQKEAEEIVNEAHQVCPYSNAIRNNVDVKLIIRTT